MDRFEILKKIEGAMRESAQIMLNADRSPSMIDAKEGHANFVTIYDKKVQKDIEGRLLEILPEASFVGEEDDIHENSLPKGYVFIVDPIDGTTNFIKDLKCSTISVGLLLDGKQYIGAIYNPYSDEMFTAIKGEGAWLNGNPIHVSDCSLKDGVVMFGTAPYYEEHRNRSMAMAKDMLVKCIDIRRSGAATVDLTNVACGRAEMYFEMWLQPWDHAAGSLIVTEAGGIVSGVDGEEIIFTGPCSIMATNQVVRKEI